MSHRTTPTWRRTGPPLVVGRADDRRGEPRVGELVNAWRVEIDRRHIYLGEGRLLGWLHRARFYEQHEGGRSAPYFIIEGDMCPASRERDLRMPVVELTRPYPPGPPPESPVYPRCPECGGALGLDEYEADAGLIRCYGFRQTCTTCGGTGLWGEWEAGLYHERFAQMQGYWEDWRKKKAKGKRHYAMCANEQGAGVRFTMQGGVKELPRVREMCILQCQAVAQWEEKPGRCHTLFENGKFTSVAAERAMELDVVPASPEVRDAFIGAWKGIGNRGITIETVIERVDADGGVAGTGCSEYPNGALAWRTLDEATFVNGDRITFMNGNVRMTLMRNGAQSGTPELVRTWPSGWQRRAPVQPMSTTGCNGRFTMEAAAERSVERQADDAPIVGAWSGRWKSGTIAEIEIKAVDPSGAFTGRYCTKRTSGLVWLWDVGPGRRFEGTVTKGGKKARFTIPTGNGTGAELEFKMKGDSKLTMKHKARAGTNREKASTVRMVRGAAEDGCLRRTTRS